MEFNVKYKVGDIVYILIGTGYRRNHFDSHTQEFDATIKVSTIETIQITKYSNETRIEYGVSDGTTHHQEYVSKTLDEIIELYKDYIKENEK